MDLGATTSVSVSSIQEEQFSEHLKSLKKFQNKSGAKDLVGLDETEEGLKKVATAFEGIFIQMLSKEMKKTLHPEEGIFPPSTASEFYEELLSEERAKTPKAGFGLAEVIIQTYKNTVSPSEPPVKFESLS